MYAARGMRKLAPMILAIHNSQSSPVMEPSLLDGLARFNEFVACGVVSDSYRAYG